MYRMRNRDRDGGMIMIPLCQNKPNTIRLVKSSQAKSRFDVDTSLKSLLVNVSVNLT